MRCSRNRSASSGGNREITSSDRYIRETIEKEQLNILANDHCNWGSGLNGSGSVEALKLSKWLLEVIVSCQIVNRRKPCQSLLAPSAVAPTKIADYDWSASWVRHCTSVDF